MPCIYEWIVAHVAKKRPVCLSVGAVEDYMCSTNQVLTLVGKRPPFAEATRTVMAGPSWPSWPSTDHRADGLLLKAAHCISRNPIVINPTLEVIGVRRGW
jgi:hypothetical protein